MHITAPDNASALAHCPKVLIVDDGPAEAGRLKSLFEEAGYESHCCETEHALDKLGQLNPTLLVCKTKLTQSDGFSLCCSVREHPFGADIPVLLLSSHYDPQDILRALSCGANHFLPSPFEDAELLRRAQELLSNHRQNDREGGPMTVWHKSLPHIARGNRRQHADLLLSIYENTRIQSEQLDLANKELLARDELMRGILTSLPVHVAVLSNDGGVVAANESWEHFPNGYRAACPADEDIPWDESLRRIGIALRSHMDLWTGIEAVIAGNEPKFTLEYPWGLGERQYWLHAQVTPLCLGNGGVLVTHEDITEKRRMLTEITKSRDQAEDASKAKAEFLANMSHEIRTPLNGVLGMAELAMMTDLDDEQREYLQMIQSSAGSLMGLINDILDFSKIEAGKLVLEAQPFSLRELVDESLKMVSVAIKNKDILIKSMLDPDLPEAFIGDPGRIKQVLLNLLSNAVKFTDHGLVQVNIGPPSPDIASHFPDGSQEGTMLWFRVSDTGTGIPKDKLTAIFDSFTQLDGSLTRRHEGTGLGLAICKRLITTMGGNIWAVSAPGVGSTFSFLLRLPAGELPESASAPDTPAPLCAPVSQCKSACTPKSSKKLDKNLLNILLAEDNPVNQRFASVLLKKIGHEITCVANGQAALDAFNRQTFDLVLMDVQMPVMDGLEATRRIRAGLTKAPADIPILALTAHAMKGDKERFLAAGMDAYVAKPLVLDDLLKAISQVTGIPCPAPRGGPGARTKTATAGGVNKVFSATQDGSPIDTASAMEAARGNTGFLGNLYAIWLDDAPKKMKKTEQALIDGDLTLLRKSVHAMKGAAGTLRAKPLFDAALALEKAAAEGNAAMCQTLYRTFVLEQQRLTNYLKDYLAKMDKS